MEKPNMEGHAPRDLRIMPDGHVEDFTEKTDKEKAEIIHENQPD